MVLGLPGNGNLKRLALIHDSVNGRKGIFFKGSEVTSADQGSDRATRVMQRNTAGVFYYMRRPEIWPRFTETSQHMETVLQLDGELDLPDRTAGQPLAGLRDLYCYWIDRKLQRIEDDARDWLIKTANDYNARYSGTSDHLDWTTNVLKPNGYISEKALKFPKARGHGNPNSQSPMIWPQSNYENLWKSSIGAAGPF
ncbi:hypothetical protein FVEG_16813 [Fusarium verticillioides 7600]|uniref:Uncharacterized protein n=1 Tax=Gibberella moniliformis (strain M3125 / FGSC 7600) TaxID=334819 RepID=W7MKE6_GIBM7|nr:hypothetical protein FVEG_16813 [Fusarium verticillioides 7600]EWG51561.1 hypothetical protein FVEG_16813 [Fusarium verticillioides 7600]